MPQLRPALMFVYAAVTDGGLCSIAVQQQFDMH